MSTLIRNALYSGLNIASRILNFVLFWIILNRLGASGATDWFFFLNGFVAYCIAVAFYSIENAFVPTWPRLTPADISRLICSFAYIGVLALLLFQILGGLLSHYLAGFFGFPNPFSVSKSAVISLLLFSQPSLALFSAMYSSLLQSSGRYFWPITHLTWRTAGVLAALWLPARHEISGVAAAFTAGELLRLILLKHAARKTVPQLNECKPVQRTALRPFSKTIGWMVVLVCASGINPYIDLIMVGHLGGGTATLVEYCSRLRGIPMLALSGILVVLFGDWSRLHGPKLGWETVRNATWQITAACVVMVALLVSLRSFWLPIIFRSDHFSPNQMALIDQLMFWYLAGAPWVIATATLAKGLLVWQAFRTPAIISILAVFANILFNMVLIASIGATGVAISTFLMDIIMASAFYLIGRKKGYTLKVSSLRLRQK